MNMSTTQATFSISLIDLEVLIRRVVREAVHEELASILDYVEHEGADDPAGDAEILADALALSRRYRDNKEGWKSWEDFKEELKRAEAAGELPR